MAELIPPVTPPSSTGSPAGPTATGMPEQQVNNVSTTSTGGYGPPGLTLSDDEIAQRITLVELLTKRRMDVVQQLNDLGSYTQMQHNRTFSDDAGDPGTPGAHTTTSPRLRPGQQQPTRNIFATILGGMFMHLLGGLKDGSFSVHSTDYNHCTPLHIAAYEGRRDMVNLLLQFGADIEALDSEGRTAMDLAQRGNQRTGSIIRQDLMAAAQCRVGSAARSDQIAVGGTTGGGDSEGAGEDTAAGAGNSHTPSEELGCGNGGGVRNRSIGHQMHPSVQDDLSLIGPQNPSGATFATRVLAAAGGGGATGGGPGSGDEESMSNSASSTILHPGENAKWTNDETDTSSGALNNNAGDKNDSGLVGEPSAHAPIASAPSASRFVTISDSKSVVVMMVGLPGRGKSFISTRIRRYMNWHGIPCRVFNAGDYRRDQAGAEETRGADFFDPANDLAKQQRELYAQMASQDLCRFLHEQNDSNGRVSVGILDATNTTRERREKMINFFSAEVPDARILFVESVCDDEDMINENIIRSKCDNKDWTGVSPETVIQDFRKRIVKYAEVYEPLDQTKEDVSFIKICNVKEHCILHKVQGGIPTRLTYFLLNLHPVAFPVYLTMPGQTEWQREGVFGGDESLTLRGTQYADKLAEFVRERVAGGVPMTVLYATDPSCVDTAQQIQERIFGPTADSMLGSPSAASATSHGSGAFRSSGMLAGGAGGGRGGTHYDPEIGNSFQDLTVIEGGTLENTQSTNTIHNNNNPHSPEHRVRFAAMHSLDGIKFGTFNAKSVGEAFHSHPKIFAKLFGEEHAKAALLSREVEQAQRSMTETDPFFNNANALSAISQGSTPVPIQVLGGSHPSSNHQLGLSPNPTTGHSAGSGIPGTGGGNSASGGVGSSGSPHEGQSIERHPALHHQSALLGIEDLVPQYHMTYPRGESHRQVNVRLERALLELMRLDGPVMVIAPQHTIQGLRCFFADQPPETSGAILTEIQTVYEQGTKGFAVTHPIEVPQIGMGSLAAPHRASRDLMT